MNGRRFESMKAAYQNLNKEINFIQERLNFFHRQAYLNSPPNVNSSANYNLTVMQYSDEIKNNKIRLEEIMELTNIKVDFFFIKYHTSQLFY